MIKKWEYTYSYKALMIKIYENVTCVMRLTFIWLKLMWVSTSILVCLLKIFCFPTWVFNYSQLTDFMKMGDGTYTTTKP